MLLVERLGADLLHVTLNRPEKRNALSLALIEQLTELLRRADSDDDVRAVVLAGAGPSFCAGVDLHELATASTQHARTLIVALEKLCATVRRLSKPVACAIQGHCLGGALELAACCDFRVCTADAQLGMPEVFVGMPSVIDAVMLGHLIGVGRARELLLTGEPISGRTAVDWGLCNRQASPAQLVQATVELLSLVTRHHPQVIAAQKRLHQEWLDVPYEQAVHNSIAALEDAFTSGQPQQIATERLRKAPPSNPRGIEADRLDG
jgi:enoyl-CoA hydratase